eukprot:CAMPEP_0182466594 /NCGR_PEP_ID=MMETSP1319-20130603/12354_1 /TAXON_ID=172717 /ORGANISM="Bolidomonas pacifica, Strain RCC208" /LENGTH=31 /DNA_ID= /DNA_START= /DNA_END= /DNA_ORIENTATION=
MSVSLLVFLAGWGIMAACGASASSLDLFIDI